MDIQEGARTITKVGNIKDTVDLRLKKRSVSLKKIQNHTFPVHGIMVTELFGISFSSEFLSDK
jgi:hypothetical protein